MLVSSPTWKAPEPINSPSNEKDLLILPTNFVDEARDICEFGPKFMLAIPPPLICTVSGSFEVISTFKSNVRLLSGELF